ncbi:MAG: branched-chain amino acid ABC transporter permease [Oscillospiraceae bacterium]|nr:branched-chain amino acid ABC transporter permease [Oscillospiraceae bacterium]
MFLQQLVTGISIGGIYALLATGYSLIYSLLDFSNWSHGEFAMIGAYVAIVCSNMLGLPFFLAAVAGVLGGAAISFLSERVAYRRIRRTGAPNMFLMIAAMGLSNVFQQAALLIFSGQYRSYDFRLPVSTIKIGTAYLGVLDFISLIITAVILFFLMFLINKTKFGLNVRAIACNANAARVLGVRVDQSIATVFVLAGSLAGAAGILYGMKYNVFPSMGNVGLKAFIASVIGGLGSVPGAIVGAVLLGVLETFVAAYISSPLRDFFSFALLIVLLIVKPSGLFGVDVQDKA